MINFTPEQIDAAIEAEVADWSRWGFDSEEEKAEALERRRAFHRANVAQGHLGALKRFLGIVPVMTYRLAEAVETLKKLAKKAERYGTAPITWTVGGMYWEERTHEDGRKYRVSVVDLALSTMEAPRVGDYTFVARLERTDAGVIVDTVPGESLPERFWHTDGSCEHCRVTRARKDLFVVRDPEGTLVQVGRTCLRDYMGTDTPASVAARFRFERELREFDEEFGGRGQNFPDSAEELLAVTAAAIRLWGWVPKSAPESAGEPTAYRVGAWFRSGVLTEAEKADRKALDEAVGEADYEIARAAMEWVASDESGDSDYIRNLRVVLAPGAVDAKRRGYACSAVAAYQRHLGVLEQKRREREAAAESQYVGTVKERLKGLKVTCLSARGFDGYYGHTVLYKFRDEAGNMFSWFASGGADLDPGSEYVLDATVKSHEEYNGVRETCLTRAVVK